MYEVPGGTGALLALLACAQDFVELSFDSTNLAIRSISKTSRFESRVSVVPTGNPSAISCALQLKDLVEVLGCVEALQAPKIRLGFLEESAKLCVEASEDEDMDFRCEIKTVDEDIICSSWSPMGRDYFSVKIDTETLHTAFSQIHEKGDGRIIFTVSPSSGLHLAQEGVDQGVGFSSEVSMPPSVFEGTLTSTKFGLPMKDVGPILGFLSGVGDSKTSLSACETGLRFSRGFFTANQGVLEVLTTNES
jgi:hypothetical protein